MSAVVNPRPLHNSVVCVGSTLPVTFVYYLGYDFCNDAFGVSRYTVQKFRTRD